MVPTKAVKTTALATLKGKWGNATVMAMIPLFASIIIYLCAYLLSLPMGNFSAIIGIVMFVLVAAPLWLGALRCYWRMANGCEDTPAQVFYYFNNKSFYKRAFAFNVRLIPCIVIAMLVFFIPAALIMFFTNETFYELIGIATPLWVLDFRYIANAFIFLGWAASIAFVVSLYMPAFLIVANEDMEPVECIKRGIEIGRYTKNRFAAYIFSYIGWILLSVFMVPVLFTAPYLLMSYVVACRYGVAHYNRLGNELQKVPTHEI